MRKLIAIAVILSFGSTVTAPAAFALPAQGQIGQGQQVVTNTGTITGTVQDSSGHVVKEGQAQAMSGGQEIARAPIAGDGTFTITNVPPGIYTIQVLDTMGQLLATCSGTVTAGQVATVGACTLTTLGATLAGAGAAGARGLFTGASLFAILGAAGAGIAAVAIVTKKPKASPSQ